MAGVGQLLRYFGIVKGYEKGVEFVGAMQSSGLIDKMTRLAGIAAYTVIGGFVYKFVTINVPWSLSLIHISRAFADLSVPIKRPR